MQQQKDAAENEREREQQQGAVEEEREIETQQGDAEREGRDRAKPVRPDASARIIEVNRNR